MRHELDSPDLSEIAEPLKEVSVETPRSREEWFGCLRDGSCKSFAHVVGEPISVEIEHNFPQRIDHVLINLEVAALGPIRLAVNTISARNKAAGFDPRVRVGVVRETYAKLPEQGISEIEKTDYAEIESAHNVFYEFHSKHEMEKLLLAKGRSALLVEAWGDLYARNHFGLHQIHSRRASCAVSENIVGRDGALRFYFREENRSELYLFKFCGQ